MIEFKPWPKTPRLNRDMVITEKIDGTNAAVQVIEGVYVPRPETVGAVASFEANGTAYTVGAQSRNRIITPEQDNFGFATWVRDNVTTLAVALGDGVHYGEWWGSGIQRGYGLTKGEKRFSLFNVNRYGELDLSEVPGLGVVPVLSRSVFDSLTVELVVQDLRDSGSRAAPGFMRPEGVIIYHSAAQQVYKVTLENDDAPKGRVA